MKIYLNLLDFCPNCGVTFHEWQHVRSWNQGSLKSFMMKQGYQMLTSKETDFSSDTLKRKVISFLRRILNASGYPHLIASFKK